MTANDIRSIRRRLAAAGYSQADIATGIAYAKQYPGARDRVDGLEMALDCILIRASSADRERASHAFASH